MTDNTFLSTLHILFHLALIVLSESFFLIEVINTQSVLERRVNEELYINITLLKQQASFSDDFNKYSLCLWKDGKRCHCYNAGDINSISVRLMDSCIDNATFWFSLSLSIGQTTKMSSPVRVPAISLSHSDAKYNTNDPTDQLTLVLPLTIDDISRALILLQSLSHPQHDSLRIHSSSVAQELLIIVPDTQHDIIKMALSRTFESFKYTNQFCVKIIHESLLFPSGKKKIPLIYPYAIQMAVKLLISKHVKTNYYITLDADLILLKPLAYEHVIRETIYSIDDIKRRGIYENEYRSVHLSWWEGSSNVLKLNGSNASSHVNNANGFGVTPAVLSTFGSRLLIEYLLHLYGENLEKEWLQSFGTTSVWSEYTLYRLVLDHYGIFDYLHISQSESKAIANDGIINRLGKNCAEQTFPNENSDSDSDSKSKDDTFLLHCHDIWFSHQLPWDPVAALRSNCLFSVIQSTTGASSTQLLNQLVLAQHPAFVKQ